MKDRKLEALKKRMSGFQTKISHGDVGGKSFALTKKMSHEYFKAKKNKKKLPELKKAETVKNPEYAKMSIADWEKKYL